MLQQIAFLIMGFLVISFDEWIVRTRVRKQHIAISEDKIRWAILGTRGIGVVFVLLSQ